MRNFPPPDYSRMPLGFWGNVIKFAMTLFLFGLVVALYLALD